MIGRCMPINAADWTYRPNFRVPDHSGVGRMRATRTRQHGSFPCKPRFIPDVTIPNELLFLHPEQRLFRVLSWHGHDVICQICLTPAATREANITKEAATISLKCADFQFVVRGYHPVPVQPPLPAVGHSVGNINVHDACSLPVPSPLRC